MAAISITPANVSANQNQGSVTRDYIAGAALTVGDAVYIDSNNKVQSAQANAALPVPRAKGIVVAVTNLYGETAIQTGQYCNVCIHGPVYGFSGLANGQQIWVSKTVAGGMDDTAPSGGAFDWIIGEAVGSDVVFVNPGETTPNSV